MGLKEGISAQVKDKQTPRYEEKANSYIVFHKETGEELMRCAHEHMAMSTAHRLNADYRQA